MQFRRQTANTRQCLLRVSIVCSTVFMTMPVFAEEPIRSCPGLDVRSINISREGANNEATDAPPKTISVASITPSSIMVIAVGPVLSYVDSQDVSTHLSCVAGALVLNVTITRSASYYGAIQKNRPWRPIARLTIVLHQPEIKFKVVWALRPSVGEAPPYAHHAYPMTVEATIRSSRSAPD